MYPSKKLMGYAKKELGRIIGGVVIFLMMVSTVLAIESQPSCSSVERIGDKLVVKNMCAETISVAYCYTTGGVNLCGQHRSKHNPYYQLMTGVNPGESWSKVASDVRIAICAGDMKKYAWEGLKGYFDSTLDGSYTCWPDGRGLKTSAVSGRSSISTAVGVDLSETCSRAKSLTGVSSVEALACTCTPFARDDGKKVPFYRCQVESDGLSADPNSIGKVKELVREKISEYCKKNPIECHPLQKSTTGIRD